MTSIMTSGATMSAFGQSRTRSIAWGTQIATAEAVAASITFLLSDDGVNISGAILPSDGGMSVY